MWVYPSTKTSVILRNPALPLLLLLVRQAGFDLAVRQRGHEGDLRGACESTERESTEHQYTSTSEGRKSRPASHAPLAARAFSSCCNRIASASRIGAKYSCCIASAAVSRSVCSYRSKRSIKSIAAFETRCWLSVEGARIGQSQPPGTTSRNAVLGRLQHVLMTRRRALTDRK